MIELLMLNHLKDRLGIPVYAEVPETPPEQFVVIRKGDERREDFLRCATMMARSYGRSLLDAMELSQRVLVAMDSFPEDPRISGCYCTGEYNFTDEETKRYRYQAVFDIYYF
ncbi:MAG: hypothetical protein IKD27_08125 [Oscillospiraceae bacterium]|nr:hypothetical protein [Oscillospiraceae bacterium]